MRWTDILLCKDKRKIKRIYYESFPSKERMPWTMMLFLSMLPTTKFKAIYDDEKLCGFIYFGVLGKHVFVMFFAVDSELRNCGYGSKILSELKERYPKKMIVVTIEPTVNNPLDIRDRRKQFYIRNNFAETGCFIKSFGDLQEILVCGGTFNRKTFSMFLLSYSFLAIWPRYDKKGNFD